MIKKDFKTPRTIYYGIYLLLQLQKRNELQNEEGKNPILNWASLA